MKQTGKTLLAALLGGLCLAALLPALAAAAPGPALSLTVAPQPSNFAPGADPKPQYLVIATNVGAAPTSGPPTVVRTVLPPALSATKASLIDTEKGLSTGDFGCNIAGAQEVVCETTAPLGPGRLLMIQITVDVPAATPEGEYTTEATAEGGGAGAVSTASSTKVQSAPLAFGFLPGFAAPLTGEDGAAATSAGSHPYQQTINFAFPTAGSGDDLTNDGHPQQFSVELPRGLVGDPAASPVLCTEAQLILSACPIASQVGGVNVNTLVSQGSNGISDDPLYAMVPPPGSVAALGTNVAQIGIYAHILVGVRSDSDYGIEATTPDVLALGTTPIFGIQAQIWGDPSAESHKHVRGGCEISGGECPVEPQETALLTMPADCPGTPLSSRVQGFSWEEPSLIHEAGYQSADLQGNPVSIAGCNQLEFQPTISSQPTTNLIDSPSGLEFDLHQPTDNRLGHTAPAILKNAVVTLPEGMSVNPSQANGLGACSEEEIGLLGGGAGIHFSKAPQSCPDASKLGEVEVLSPLLVQRDEAHEVVTDPETSAPELEPLHGSVYLAEPLDNPFGSLIAIYLAIEDPATGIVAKLAGRVEPDPQTGRLTTVFEENPELPIEDVRLKLFGGDRGALITPPDCAAHATTTDLTPWSAPETADADPTSAFQATAMPGGGACPPTPAAAPDAPTFTAGTVSPEAGAYSPFVLKLSREDGSQRLTGFDTTLPPGLTGRLAGIPACPDAAIARAASRSKPEEGILEREDPSCPAASRLGTVNVGAGAGPNPFYAQGTAYLAGPYKGAPLSMVVITPAIAGPFDLGTVVVRAALYLDPDTAQIHAVSDPFPTILHGIPLDLRSVAVSLDRPGFTLNPTSCDEMAITGQAVSVFGQAAPLAQRFQVGGCGRLPFKPRLSLTLKGKTKRTSHPTLIADLTAKPGEANIAKAQVKLPKAAFLDQGHIKTVCTRVQFAAKACPPGSVYGRVSATTPLLDYPLTGNVYLRSSSHVLPDLVADLNGPASQPIEIALAGKTDSVKGALRNTFEAVPDAPVSRFHLELFGGRRGLIELTSGLCKDPRATVKLDGQNGKVFDTTPLLRTSCKKGKKGGKGKKGKKKHGKHGR